MTINPKTTAVLTLDFQQAVLGMVPGTEAAFPAAVKVLEHARGLHLQIIHVGLGFAEGHPEISDRSPFSTRIKAGNLFVKGSTSGQFHPAIAKPDELVVYKQRVGAFSENELHMILRARGIDTLVLFGISTSGVVLSTLRRAFDLDFSSIVIDDACFDPDPEVHRVLVEKVFPRQATVVSADRFIEMV
jgi:nicotinamidase-related amidase